MKLIRDGFKVEWTPMLQELADRDEISQTKVKFANYIVEAYGSSDRYECECGYDEIVDGSVFCANCGQRLNWE